MGDAEDINAPSKKRAAGRELNRDKLDIDDEEDTSELESGTFKKASEEVLATRRIVRVRRNPAAAAAAPQSNPFAGIRLVRPPVTAPMEGEQATANEAQSSDQSESKSKPEAAADKDENVAEKLEVSKMQDVQTEFTIEKVEGDKETQAGFETKDAEAESAAEKVEVGNDTTTTDIEKKEAEVESAADENTAEENESGDRTEAPRAEAEEEKAEDESKKGENTDSASGGTSFSSFQQLSSTKNAFTGLAGTGFSSSTFSFSSISTDGSTSVFGPKIDQPMFNFGLVGNGNSSVLSSSGAPMIPKAEGSVFPSKEEVVVETGEESEKVVFSADSVLFEYIDGKWKERGKGEIKVNVSTSGTEKARIIMRTKGNLRLVMNASLYPEIKLTNMEKKGITFACVNSISEGKTGLSTFAVKFKDGAMVESFREAVEAHKGKGREALKTPENSPKASEE